MYVQNIQQMVWDMLYKPLKIIFIYWFALNDISGSFGLRTRPISFFVAQQLWNAAYIFNKMKQQGYQSAEQHRQLIVQRSFKPLLYKTFQDKTLVSLKSGYGRH